MKNFENKNIKNEKIAFASEKVKKIMEKNNWETRLSIKGELTGFMDPSGGLGFSVMDKEKNAEFLVEVGEIIHLNKITKKGLKCGFLEFLKMGEEVEVTGIVIPNMVIPGRDGGYISMVAEKANNTGVMLGDGSGQGKVLKMKMGFSL